MRLGLLRSLRPELARIHLSGGTLVASWQHKPRAVLSLAAMLAVLLLVVMKICCLGTRLLLALHLRLGMRHAHLQAEMLAQGCAWGGSASQQMAMAARRHPLRFEENHSPRTLR